MRLGDGLELVDTGGLVPKAVVLLSGGLDSTTVLAIADAEGYDLHAVTFRYGQRNDVEVEAARQVAAAAGVREHLVVDLDRRLFPGSTLTDLGRKPGPNATPYVPARNTVFLSLGLSWAEGLGSRDIFVGINAVDYGGYPDCRPVFVEAFQRVADEGTEMGAKSGSGPRIHAPLLHLSKAEIIRKGAELGVDYGLTHSCYEPDAVGAACGRCGSCELRLRGFREAGLDDPAEYVHRRRRSDPC